MCSQLIPSVKGTITIDTMLNFDGGFDGHGDDGVTGKQTLRSLCITLDPTFDKIGYNEISMHQNH